MKLYNTKTRSKEEFKTISSNLVKMYVCGPTVYDDLHIGNFRGAIFFNFFRNWLEKKGYQVEYVYNYTDIDDKILARAEKENVEPCEISEKYITSFQRDYKALGLRPHTKNPKVTEYVKDIIEFIEKLVQKEAAYPAADGVYFSVASYKKYGSLSGRKLEDLMAGYRVDLLKEKKDMADFALWKISKQGEQGWDSPWGRGRPGWHIECSVMSESLLGFPFDIHGGGIDLMFPHHENEQAQSECYSNTDFVNFWVHHNMINMGDEKMSKSLGNIVKAKDFIADHTAEVLKWMMLVPHYQSEINFSKEQITLSLKEIGKFYSVLRWIEENKSDETDSELEKTLKDLDVKIIEALDDNLNTPIAFSYFFQSLKSFNAKHRKAAAGKKDKAAANTYASWLKGWGQILSLFEQPAKEYLSQLDALLLKQKDLDKKVVQSLVDQRKTYRLEKNFSESDKIRDKLQDMGIEIQDLPSGETFWEVQK